MATETRTETPQSLALRLAAALRRELTGPHPRPSHAAVKALATECESYLAACDIRERSRG